MKEERRSTNGRDDRGGVQDDRYADIINYVWNYDSLPNRMPLSQRAKIFLPFSALTGFEEAIQNTIKTEIAEMEVTSLTIDDNSDF